MLKLLRNETCNFSISFLFRSVDRCWSNWCPKSTEWRLHAVHSGEWRKDSDHVQVTILLPPLFLLKIMAIAVDFLDHPLNHSPHAFKMSAHNFFLQRKFYWCFVSQHQVCFFSVLLAPSSFFHPCLLSIEIDVNIRGLWGDHTGKKHSRGCPHYFLCISLCDFVTWPQGVRSWKEGKRSPQTWRNNWNEGWVNVSI